MRKPTTPFGHHVHNTMQINREFLLSQGWILDEDKPLFETFKHPSNGLLRCSIGFYGSFSIFEKHWCNDEPEKGFFTTNHNLTKEDYFRILSMLKLQ